MSLVLTAHNLTTTLSDRDRRFRLRADGFELRKGDVVSLFGPSGSGKTLLLEMLALLRRPEPAGTYTADLAGEVLDFAALWTSKAGRAALPDIRSRLFGFVPQTGSLLPFLTTQENVVVGQRLTGQADTAYADHLIERLGLAPVRSLKSVDLSIGQRQRTAVARALSHRPAIIIADEPTASLDPEAADTVLRLFLELALEGGCAVLLSSHDTPRIEALGIRKRFRVQATPSATDAGLVESRLVTEEVLAA
jgi:putative ABC transport system ATP-binding protein